MTAFVFYLLKVILCSGILFLYYHLALRNKAFHQWNRFYLLFSVVLSLLLPLFRFTFFEGNAEPNDALAWLRSFQQADETLEEIIIVSQNGLSEEEWFYLGYGLICFVLLTAFLFSLLRIINIIRTHSHQQHQRIKLVTTDIEGTPFSFFHFVFWNRQLPLHTEAGRQIFQHELIHVAEKHTVDKLLLQLTTILFWCNPFFWLIRNEMRNIHEFIADKKAVGEDNAATLATLLLQTAYPTQYASFTNSFFQSSIKRRLMMLSKKQSLSYAGRILALPVIAIISFAFTVRTAPQLGTTELQTAFTSGQQVTDTVPGNDIASVHVNKNSKDTTITIKYTNGSSKIYTRAEASKAGLLKDKPNLTAGSTTKSDTAPKPLCMIDGKEFYGDMNAIDPSRIQSVNVFKGKAATDKYGEKGKNGVVEITLKKNAGTIAQQESEPIFEKAETPASIDMQAWRSFLETQLQPLIVQASKQGVKPGKYTVNVRFLVKKDGSISDFSALNNPGYDFDKQMLAIMHKSPKWNPAAQNGRLVNSYHTQPITLVVQEQ